MIKKIKKLKDFGVFYNFAWDTSVPEFKRFNLIYGWNRSGKTTFSRIFSSCEKKTTGFGEYPADGEFEIETDGVSIKSGHLGDCNLNVRVFNKDFIDENISFDPSRSSKPIIYISEEDIHSKQQLDELEKEKEALEKEIEKLKARKKEDETAEERFRISTAQNIKTTVASFKVRDQYYDYNKSTLKSVLDVVGIKNFKKLANDDDLEKYKGIITSEVKPKQNAFSEYEVDLPFNTQKISDFNKISSILEDLLTKKVVSETLDRLREDSDLNNWVKRGFDLHRSKGEYEKCLFCQNSFEGGFFESLAKHFNEDYEELQNKITDFISKLDKLKKEKVPEINNNISSELQSNYAAKAEALNKVVDSHNQWIDDAVEKLQEKYQNTFAVVQLPKTAENFKKAYDTAVKDLNSVINSHNSQVDNHDAVVKSTKEKLEYHLIAVAIDEQGYDNIKKNLDNSINNLEVEERKLEKMKEKLDDLEKKTSNIGKAVQEINKHLEEFFGRKEIQLKLDKGNLGYFIERDGDLAQNLSEGEKTAIAFSYFIAKTLERDFKVTDGIIFIDDPISSFDSNFIYHCFSVIKNRFKDAGQLFVSTHNFELLNLIKEWYSRKNSKAKGKGKGEICEFYMLENVIKNGKRHAGIIRLEETLRNFKSEYHYLFYLLCRFSDKTVPEYADYYTIGNVARRFLEIFANFKIPTTGDLSSKIGELGIDTSKISETEQDKVYKLIQEFSHGMDPTSTIEHKDKRESKEAIRILLDMIRESDPKHFELLQRTRPS